MALPAAGAFAVRIELATDIAIVPETVVTTTVLAVSMSSLVDVAFGEGRMGVDVGDIVGTAVGMDVGVPVGDGVGDDVGKLVGSAVGAVGD